MVVKIGVGLPLAITKDVVTMGGAMTDKKQPYTSEKIIEIADELNDIFE